MPAQYFSSARELSAFITGVAASGRIIAPELRNITNGAYFDLNDGTNAAVRFHFDRSGAYTPGGGYNATNIRVDVSAAVTRNDVATAIRAAINGVGAGLAITAGAPPAAGWELRLTNDAVGVAGNVPVTTNNLPYDMTVEGMTGGGGPVLAADFVSIVPIQNQFVLFYR
jgi:hypothetical protein